MQSLNLKIYLLTLFLVTVQLTLLDKFNLWSMLNILYFSLATWIALELTGIVIFLQNDSIQNVLFDILSNFRISASYFRTRTPETGF